MEGKIHPSLVVSIHLGLYFQVGQKKAREMWFLARFYNAEEADKMGLVNKVVPVRNRSVCPPFMPILQLRALDRSASAQASSHRDPPL